MKKLPSALPKLRWLGARPRTPPAAVAEALETTSTKALDPIKASLQALDRPRKAQLAPALLLATGAGAAFWWWTQWARGAAESEAARDGQTLKPDA